MNWRDGMSLGEARAELRKLLNVGERCPCCTQMAKVYKRGIHGAMARDLIAAYRRFGAGVYFDLTDVVGKRGTGDVTKLRYWGMLEPEPGERADGSNRTGRWRITDAGEHFVNGLSRVQRYARVYDTRCLGFEGDLIGVEDALGRKFDYQELMSA